MPVPTRQLVKIRWSTKSERPFSSIMLGELGQIAQQECGRDIFRVRGELARNYAHRKAEHQLIGVRNDARNAAIPDKYQIGFVLNLCRLSK
jgi:hypothetical protein